MAALPPSSRTLLFPAVPRSLGAPAVPLAPRRPFAAALWKSTATPATTNAPPTSTKPPHVDKEAEKQGDPRSRHLAAAKHDDDSEIPDADAPGEAAGRDPPSMLLPSVPLPTTPSSPAGVTSTSTTEARTAELEAMADATLDAAAFWGDGRRGVARLRFGSNARAGLADATITLETDGDRLRLVVEGADADTADALAARLRAAGLEID